MTAIQYIGNKSFEVVSGGSVPPGPDEVRLSVGFVGICGTDMHIYHGAMDQRVCPPKIIGHEMSGEVVEVGSKVREVKIGDRVVVRPLDYCNNCPACDAGYSHVCHNLKFMGIDTPGAMQQSWTVKARTVHKLPDNITLRQGALIEPLAVACHDVRRARLSAREKAVILGGGPIGQLIAQVGKSLGVDILISEPSDVRRDFARNNGIETVNPLKEDVVSTVHTWTNGKGADVVFEVAGVASTVEIMTKIAAVRGRICVVAIHSTPPPVNLFDFFWKELELVGARVYEATDFEQAINIVANEKIDLEPFITSVNMLPDAAKAFTSIDGNPAGMKAIIQCSD